MELALAKSPTDAGLRITLMSAQRMARRAEDELLTAAMNAQVDLCRYKLVRSEAVAYPAIDVANSVTGYQSLFTSIYDAVKNGPKSTANYARNIREQSTLNWAYTFPGSLGVLFTIEANRDIFGDGSLDSVIAAMSNVTSIKSRSDVRSTASALGLNVVRKVFVWADFHAQQQYSIDVQWRSSSEIMRGAFVSRNEFSTVARAINEAVDEDPRDLEIVGTLGAYNILRNTFSLVTREEEVYSGRLDDQFVRRKYRIPAEYRAKIRAKTVTRYAAETVETSYTLLLLDEISE